MTDDEPDVFDAPARLTDDQIKNHGDDTMTDNENEDQDYDEVRKTVSESEDKVELKWKCKRGTGTRDEDKFAAKVKGDCAQEVVGEMIALMDGVATDQGGLMDAARGIQPEATDD